MFAQETKIIAHRGAWEEFNLPENSVAALKKAIELNCYGAEFDVRRTKDGILVVNHDPTYFGDTIQNKTYEALNNKKLANGEDLPLLETFFKTTTGEKTTQFICEIKEAINDKKQDYLAAIETLELAKKTGIENKIIYISFSFDILKWIKEKNPKAIVFYLENNQPLQNLVNEKINGINFHYSQFLNNPSLIENAKTMGMKTGSWTVNKPADLAILRSMHIEYITTNKPNEFLSLVDTAKK